MSEEQCLDFSEGTSSTISSDASVAVDSPSLTSSLEDSFGLLPATLVTEVPIIKGIRKMHSSDETVCMKCKTVKKSVSFENLEVREYPIVLGDNPGAIRGPPLTISWEPQQIDVTTIEEFEKSRPRRRSQYILRKTSDERKKLLLNAGHSLDEIRDAEAEADSIRKSRRNTEAVKEGSISELISDAKNRQPKNKKSSSRFKLKLKNIRPLKFLSSR